MSMMFDDGRARRRTRRQIAVAVLVIIIAAVAAFIATRPGKVSHAGETVGYTPPPSSAAKKAAVDPAVVIVRGGPTGCLSTGGCDSANFAGILSYKEAWDATILSGGGAGYLAGASSAPPRNFAAEVAQIVAAKPQIVLIQGSVVDQYFSQAKIAAAATSLYSAIAKQLPKAKIIVVGPAYAGKAPASIAGVEAGLKQASAHGVTLFIDPIAEKWFTGANEDLMASDHVSPSDAGHQLMATRIIADLKKAGIQ